MPIIDRETIVKEGEVEVFITGAESKLAQ